jgi:murein L,D-transpeptidase YcbB/YkuD
LSLHESATKKQYLSEATEKGGAAYVDPATDTPEAKIAREFYQSAFGAGTNEANMLKAIQSIKSAVQFWKVNELVKNLPSNSGKLDIAGVINDEMGRDNLEDVKKITEALKVIGITATYGSEDRKLNSGGVAKLFKENTFKITSQPVVAKTGAELDATWATTYKCVTSQTGATPRKLKDNSTAYQIGNVIYYANGRKLVDGKTYPYTCAEFKSNTPVVDRKKVYQQQLASRLKQSQKGLGLPESGALDTATLQAMITKLSPRPQVQPVTSVVPANVQPLASSQPTAGMTPEQLQAALQALTQNANRPV